MPPPAGFPDRERIRLQRFISGIRIVTRELAGGAAPGTPRVVKKCVSHPPPISH